MKNKRLENYLHELNNALARGDSTEHTHRPALKTLLESLKDNITATNEPKRVACGAPDFAISRKKYRLEQVFGYIECKDIGVDLKREEKSDQLKRYRAAIDNLILTDYINFRFYQNGELIETAALAKEGKGGKFMATEGSMTEVLKLFSMFFASEPAKVKSAKELAQRMAGIARLLRGVIDTTFSKESEHGALHGQYEAFKKVLLHDLKEDEFADMYAQTICYGLFAARCHVNDQAVWGKDIYAAHHGVDGKAGEFTREKAAYLLPKTNPFLRNIFGDIAGVGMDERIAWLVDDLVALLQNAAMDKVLRGFARTTKRTDPVVHFYETFLAAYDPKLRESRGVYYTPEPVVSYIVRSVDRLLKDKFGLKQGLRDNKKIPLPGSEKNEKVHRCLVLDPAAGTGTFLYEVINQIRKKFRDKGAWNAYVKDHLLPRLHGFELMMAPYAVCHMKLGLELAETGYDFPGNERLGVYLTNTLEEAEEMSGFPLFTQWLAEEARAANVVKRDLPIMVVLGNPPYSGHSANASWKLNEKGKKVKNFIGNLVDDYYFVDGKPLGEKNPKWLQDDYVKFIRYGQHRIAQTGSGVLAFITNHGYLDNPTFRGMRQQLMQTFSEIYILDLHGNSKKKEVCPDGSPDKNVFDIQQGVSIGIFVKEADTTGDAKVYHADLWGERKSKYEWLNKNDIKKTDWNNVTPEKPYYFFINRNEKLSKEYEQHTSIKDLFHTLLLGPNSHRDHFAISFSEEEALSRIDDFFNDDLSDDDLRGKYNLTDNRDWKLNKARSEKPKIKSPVSCIYRPFDSRYMLYGSYAFDYHRPEVNDNMLQGNFGLITTRQTKEQFSAFSCSKPVGQHKLATPYDGSYISPLYLYPTDGLFSDTGGDWPAGKGGRVPNLDKGFVDEMAECVKLKFVSDGCGDLKKSFGPEDVFAWIYGIFHCPQYRQRYEEFLKIDFPRVPLPKDKQQFTDVCQIGRELVSLHLMEAEILDDPDSQPQFPVEGDMTVEKGYPKFDNGKVLINEKQYFEPVSEGVWQFMIGGYQVCEKWLKDRRGRTLSYDDVEHYKKICVALNQTGQWMTRLDDLIAAYGGWPISRMK